MLCGSGKLGVDLLQLIVAPTVAYKLSPHHSLGASLLLVYQRFKTDGLQAFDNAPRFPPFTGSPGNVTNNGYDSATGAGLRLGWQRHVSDGVTLGASYSTKVYMRRFKKYSGLFAQAGRFDIPANYSVGIAVKPSEQWTLAADYVRIAYSKVAAVGNSSSAMAPLGAENSPGFGWRDVDVFKLGAAYSCERVSDTSCRLQPRYQSGAIAGGDIQHSRAWRRSGSRDARVHVSQFQERRVQRCVPDRTAKVGERTILVQRCTWPRRGR